MLKERAAATRARLGLEKYEAPIFYACPVGIRFEIGVGSPYASNKMLSKRYVKAALKRAYTIYQNAPGSFDTLLWVIYPDGNTSEDELFDNFINITGLPLPQERYSELLPQDEPRNEIHCYWDLRTCAAEIERLLGEIIKADIGGLRDLSSSVFFLNTELNILFYLYDDRGLDIVAESRGTIAPIYKKFSEWILEYDRAEIDRSFNQGDGT